ncbi:MAG: hypothetical protein ACRCX8_10370 [Sarcina sp.]
MKIGYCELCKRDVPMNRKFNWVAFLLWCLVCGVGGFVYIAYYLFKSRNRCPICNNKIRGRGKDYKKADNLEVE